MKSYIITEEVRDSLAEVMAVIADPSHSDVLKPETQGMAREIIQRLHELPEHIPATPEAEAQPDQNQTCDCDCPRSYDESNRCTVCGKPPAHVIPQPEAPKDWSGHEHYGDCHYCEINEQYSKQAACWVCMHLVDCGKVDNWQPRTP